MVTLSCNLHQVVVFFNFVISSRGGGARLWVFSIYLSFFFCYSFFRMTSNELRRRLLKALHTQYLEDERATTPASKLREVTGADDEVQLWEDVRFLHDEEYITGTPVPFERDGYLEDIAISLRGARLMDDPAGLDRAFPVDDVHLAVDRFLHQMRLEFERADMDEDEKEQFFLYLEKFSANPGAASVLYRVINTCFLSDR